MSNLLTWHEVLKAENEVLKAQMKYQRVLNYDNEKLIEKTVIEIVQLTKEAKKRKVKMERKK